MKIFIIGSERCGKSSAAFFLSQALNCEYAETGRLVINELAKLYATGNGAPESYDTWVRIIGLHKDEFRHELGVVGDLITTLAPTHLIDDCAKRARIVVGVRRRREVLSFFRNCSRQDWNCRWIKIVAPQPAVSGSRYELRSQPCDYEVVNDGDLPALQEKMQTVARKIQSKPAA